MGETQLIVAAVAFASILLLFYSARQRTTICVLDARDGELRITHGGLSPRILSDLRDVAERPKVKYGSIRIVRRSGRAEVSVSGLFSAAQIQQVRNVVGSVPLARLANARDSRGL
jgi:hypothetical protein